MTAWQLLWRFRKQALAAVYLPTGRLANASEGRIKGCLERGEEETVRFRGLVGWSGHLPRDDLWPGPD